MTARPVMVAVLAGGTLAAAALWSCSVDRRSPGLACSPNQTCSFGRVCEDGFCVVDGIGGLFPDGGFPLFDGLTFDSATCPAACQSCNGNHTCVIEGTGSGDIACPPGWSCKVNCNSKNACGKVVCPDAPETCNIQCNAPGACQDLECGSSSCTVHCTAGSACGAIDCTTGDCTTTCNDDGACGNITCGTGACTATCNGSNACGNVDCHSSCSCNVECLGGECGTMTCPMPGGEFCTETGSDGAPCTSLLPGCMSC